MVMLNKDRQCYQFGPFRVDPDHRLLLRENQPVPLQPKAFDILLTLIRNPENIVFKDDLMKTVWPETFVEESNLTQNIFLLRKALGEAKGDNRYIVTIPGKGYRFAEKVQAVRDDESEALVIESHSRARMVITDARAEAVSVEAARQTKPASLLLRVTVVAVLGLVAIYYFTHRAPRLTAKDTVVLADFNNLTGDPVFDAALRPGLSAQLDQSPFLNLLPDRRVAQALALMSQPKDGRLTTGLARDVCQRTASTAVLDGTIAQIGTRYLLTVKATACSTGDTLATAEAVAADKNQVLDALGKVASDIRGKLGESLASVQKYDVPPQDVTTGSLDALQSYGLAMKNRNGNSNLPIQLFQRAITQDPNFAMAYAQLGVIYVNIGENERGAENIRKAYSLDSRVSEHEKLYISSHYDDMVMGDLVAARKDYELWAQIYPRDFIPSGNLAVIDYLLGNFEDLFAQVQKAIDLNGDTRPSPNVVWTYVLLNRFDEAKALALRPQKEHFDDPGFHLNLYAIDFLQHDYAAMHHEAEGLFTNPNWGDAALNNEAHTSAYFGEFSKSREFTDRAVAFALHADEKERAAAFEAEAALAEAMAGNAERAKQRAKTALTYSEGKNIQAMAALAFSMAGDSAEARKIATNLSERYPQATVMQLNYLPTIHAATDLWNDNHKTNTADAIQTLAPVSPYELGVTALDEGICLYPVYVRAEAYLAAKDGASAAREFQKIIDHAGAVDVDPMGAMAHLGLARANSLSGNSSKAKAEYQLFLDLWKNADADLPMLKAAKAEYAKLS